VQEQALIAYEKSLLTSFEDVENALTAYAVGRERVAARLKAAESARRANDLARTLYQAGAADFQKVLDTDRTRLTAEETLASADADLLTAVIQLYKALGGGWQNAST
jgi:outer membrane protein TolC